MSAPALKPARRGGERQRTPLHVASGGDRRGWFKASRFSDMPQLVRVNRNAFVLAYLIAYRSRWNEQSFNPLALGMGWAAIDYETWGLTRQEFRTAKSFLEKHGLATFSTTNAGTLGKLLDTRLFEVLPDDCNHQSHNAATMPATSNQEQKSGKSKQGDLRRPSLSASQSVAPSKRQLTDGWMQAYQRIHGQPYLFQGVKDGTAADRLLSTGMPVDELLSIAIRAWRKPDAFNCKQAASLAGFAARFNEIRAEVGMNGNHHQAGMYANR